MIKIRKGNIDNIPQIKKCLIVSWVDHAKNVSELLDEERMRKSDIEGYYKKAFDNVKEAFILIVEVDGKFAGFLRADIQKIPDFFKFNNILYLDDCYVLPEFRRMGIATFLIKEAEKIARKNKIKRLQGRVYSYNKSIQKLLVKLGYTSPHSTWDKVLI
ncbi:MAG: GNAT family acetyltransferase [Candidatus Woesebacteria bacterium GW2011_GWA1_33_30]|uniref:GNAT family acetyltransferase n=1 Tax=Candidatus Woesebacteria bacterium GW2011_GWA2_33_28 TaxID=1618561 RepID=A0A0G0CYC5_9BACT|nr:MAG: GNAT family acetyltransferase [Candidatus Woesebacteria bacterium GW2011_GWA2_33_28]KKP49124.1 MAG: GNAT family acetyltransferase [Candidatus Woesebacteria bacterium GW2011_GWA1_33_30]KKP50276.1 MAG: GNAT family acetyltransferase [Microgenomates group bacterium GW2011_GWC1_33_32]KKP52715.1 MAG: GNAT family acetyltransferase [Candidatus Woesebacteria bacterium GW2011_GWB1_33_38]